MVGYRRELGGTFRTPTLVRSRSPSLLVSEVLAAVVLVLGVAGCRGGWKLPTHPVGNGRRQDKLTVPAAAVGLPLTFRAVMRTRLGSITLDWPITVQG